MIFILLKRGIYVLNKKSKKYKQSLEVPSNLPGLWVPTANLPGAGSGCGELLDGRHISYCQALFQARQRIDGLEPAE